MPWQFYSPGKHLLAIDQQEEWASEPERMVSKDFNDYGIRKQDRPAKIFVLVADFIICFKVKLLF